jgi:hypothetical protein
MKYCRLCSKKIQQILHSHKYMLVKPEERDHLEHMGIDWRIILK